MQRPLRGPPTGLAESGPLRGHGLFGYVPVLQEALQPLEATRCGVVDRFGTWGVYALSRVWQSESGPKHPFEGVSRGQADARRHLRKWPFEAARPVRGAGPSNPERQRLNQVWAASLDEASRALGDKLWAACRRSLWGDGVAAILGQVWRGSSLAECVNSKLRPILNRRDQTESGPSRPRGP